MPGEKLRLRPWLEKEINSGKIEGLSWVDRDKKIFKVPWKHASRHGWCLDRDACVFRAWAIHNGRFRKHVDAPDPRRWKANFRCALNALPDIHEVPNQGISRGNHAFKVYQMRDRVTAKKDSTKAPKCKNWSTVFYYYYIFFSFKTYLSIYIISRSLLSFLMLKC